MKKSLVTHNHKIMNYHATPPEIFTELVNRDLLKQYAPAAVLINRSYEILHFQGPTVNFLEFPKGTPTNNIITLLRKGLNARVRSAVDYVFKENKPFIDHDAKIKRNGHYVPFTLTVRPVFDPKFSSDLLLITFEESKSSACNEVIPETNLNSSANDSNLIEQLKYELNTTRKDLLDTVETLNKSNEEIKTFNEEVLSKNEELNTVNSELHFKFEELERSYNDTKNLLFSTDIATIILDEKLQIILFNSAIAEVLNVQESDVGRSISDFSARVANDHLLSDAHQVLEKLIPIEKDVWSNDTHPSRCYLRRIMPYRTLDENINGVIITFIDITKRHQQKIALEQNMQEHSKALNAREARLASIMRFASEAIVVMDEHGIITDFNQAAENIFGYKFFEISGKNINKLVPDVQFERRKSNDSGKVIALAPLELQALRKDGNKFLVKLTTTIIEKDKICISIITDLSEVSVLKKAIIDVSTEEQEKIGRDVHDNLGQRLTGINLLVSNLKRNKPNDETECDNKLMEIMDQISLSIGETRNISHGLSPILFPPKKLQEALIELIDMVKKANIESEYEFSKILNVPDNTVAIQIYRIAQEAINNAIKYAKASNISLQLKTHLDKMILVIQDNGVGFLLKDNKADWGIGLKIMQYRSSSINANLLIESAPNKGTIIRCIF